MAEETLLEIEQLSVAAHVSGNERVILSALDLEVLDGQRVGLVGESGSGKSMTVGAIMGLLPENVEIASGEVTILGQSTRGLSEAQFRKIRGAQVSIVYQNALSSLNPVIPVGRQIADVAHVHLGLSKKDAFERAIVLMDKMGIPDAEKRAHDYAHQFSGGMAQRVAIAMALVSQPKLVIADEPTTGLDATIQMQVLDTIRASIDESGAALLLISHDLAVVSKMTEQIVVLYAGVVLEQGPTDAVIREPLNPYTRGLVASVMQEGDTIDYIPGRIPEPGTVPANHCPFAARCPLVSARCTEERPALREIRPGRFVACHNVE